MSDRKNASVVSAVILTIMVAAISIWNIRDLNAILITAIFSLSFLVSGALTVVFQSNKSRYAANVEGAFALALVSVLSFIGLCVGLGIWGSSQNDFHEGAQLEILIISGVVFATCLTNGIYFVYNQMNRAKRTRKRGTY